MKKLLLTLALGGLMGASAFGVTLQCNDAGITTINLVTGGNLNPFCALGGLTFSNFTVTETLGATGAPVSIGSGSSYSNGVANLIFQFTGLNTPTSGDVTINYTVTGGISGVTETLGNSTNTTIHEIVCAGLGGASCAEVTRLADITVGPSNPSATKSFATQSSVSISKDVSIGSLVNGVITNGQISDFTNGHTSGVPEPGSMALLGSGLVGLGFIARRRAQK